MARDAQTKALLVNLQGGDRMLQNNEQTRAPGGDRPQLPQPVAEVQFGLHVTWILRTK